MHRTDRNGYVQKRHAHTNVCGPNTLTHAHFVVASINCTFGENVWRVENNLIKVFLIFIELRAALHTRMSIQIIIEYWCVAFVELVLVAHIKCKLENSLFYARIALTFDWLRHHCVLRKFDRSFSFQPFVVSIFRCSMRVRAQRFRINDIICLVLLSSIKQLFAWILTLFL